MSFHERLTRIENRVLPRPQPPATDPARLAAAQARLDADPRAGELHAALHQRLQPLPASAREMAAAIDADPIASAWADELADRLFKHEPAAPAKD